MVVKSLKTGVHIKGGGFHTLTLHPTIGSSRPRWQWHAAIPVPLPAGSGGNSRPPALDALSLSFSSLESWQFCLCTEMLVFEPRAASRELLYTRPANHNLEMSLGSWDLGCFHPRGCSKGSFFAARDTP